MKLEYKDWILELSGQLEKDYKGQEIKGIEFSRSSCSRVKWHATVIFEKNVLMFTNLSKNVKLYKKVDKKEAGESKKVLGKRMKLEYSKVNNMKMTLREQILFNVNEEFVDTMLAFSQGGKSVYGDVYKNPSRKEIREVMDAGKEVRFILVFDTQDLYVFPPYLLHHKVASKFKIPYQDVNSIAGTGVYKPIDDLILVTDSITFREAAPEFRKKIKEKDWSWAEEKRKIVLNRIFKGK